MSEKYVIDASKLLASRPSWATKTVLQSFCIEHKIAFQQEDQIADLVFKIQSLDVVDLGPLDFNNAIFAANASKGESKGTGASAGATAMAGASDATLQTLVTSMTNLMQTQQDMQRQMLQFMQQSQLMLTAMTANLQNPAPPQNVPPLVQNPPMPVPQVQAQPQVQNNPPPLAQVPQIVPQLVPQGNAPVQLPGFRVPTFEGDVDKHDPFEWLTRYHDYAVTAQWDPAQTIRLAGMYMSGEARSKWQEVAAVPNQTWNQVKHAWIESTGMLQGKRSIFKTLLSALKQDNHTVTAYSLEFCRLARLAYCTAAFPVLQDEEHWLIEKFISGLRLDIQMDVRRTEPLRLSNARAIAERTEATLAVCKGNTSQLVSHAGSYNRGGYGNRGYGNRGYSNRGNSSQSQGRFCSNCDRPGHHCEDCWRFCSHCGKSGHDIDDCWQLNGRPDFQNSQQGDRSRAQERNSGQNQNNSSQRQSSRPNSPQNDARDQQCDSRFRGNNRRGQGRPRSQTPGPCVNNIQEVDPQNVGNDQNSQDAVSQEDESFDSSSYHSQSGIHRVGLVHQVNTAVGDPIPAGIGRKPGCLRIVSGKLNKTHADMLIDSGATVSLISAYMFDRLGYSVAARPTDIQSVTVNNAPLDLLGECELDVQVGNIKQKHVFAIAPGIKIPVVLGMDFFEEDDDKLVKLLTLALAQKRESQSISLSTVRVVGHIKCTTPDFHGIPRPKRKRKQACSSPSQPHVPAASKAKKRVLKEGDIVWAKGKCQPYWPSRIVDSQKINLRKPLMPDQILVQFLGKSGLEIVQRTEIFEYWNHKPRFQDSPVYMAPGVATQLQSAIREADMHMQ